MHSPHRSLNGVAIAIAILALVGQCLAQAPSAPTSRAAGYTASVDLTLPVEAAARHKLILETDSFQLWLQGDTRNACALSVRVKYTGIPSDYPGNHGHLVWVANYFSKTPIGADKCTLTFTAAGELQLWILYRGITSLTWSSKTAGKGVVRMALETAPDNGNFKLVTAANKAVFRSFDVKEFLVVKGQQFWAGEVLKSPDAVHDTDTRVLFNKGLYILAIKGGDLQLLLNGPKPQVYWSLKRSGLFKGDLSKVAYAAVAEEGGIGLYTAGRKLVYRIAPPLWVQQYGADFNFGIDFYGDLKYYLMYKGINWGFGWQAIVEDCDLPNFCSDYGICTMSADQFGTRSGGCSCPPTFNLNSPDRNSPPVCQRSAPVAKCNYTKQYLELKGYDSVFNFYATPLKVSLAVCKADCSKDCGCDGFFYDSKAKSCYKQTQFRTLKKIAASSGKSAFIKV